MFDPAEPAFDAEDALRTRLVDQVVYDHRVCRVASSVSNIGLVVLVDFIFLYVGAAGVNQEDALPVVAENQVVYYFHVRHVGHLDARLSVVANVVVLFYASEVLVALQTNAVFQVFFHPVVLDDRV